MRLARTTLVHFGSQVAISLAGFLTTWYVARALGSEVLGLYATVVALLFWITIPTGAIGSAITKRMSEGSDQSRYVSAGFVLNTAFSFTISGVVFLLDQHINAFVGASVAVLVASLVIFEGLYITTTSSLNGQKLVAKAGINHALRQVVRTIVQISLIVVGYHLVGLLWGHLFSLVFTTITGALLFELKPQLPRVKHFKNLASYARYSWLGMLKTRAFGWMDTIVLALFVSPSLIGIYEVAWNVASILVLVSLSVQQTLFPELSELNVEENYERVHHYIEEGLIFIGVFAIPGLFGAAVLGPRILRIYRPEFMIGASILLILIVARTASAYGGQFTSAINAVDRPDVAFRINLVFVIANLVLNLVLVYLYGWFGAAIATAASAVIALVLSYLALARLIGRPSIPFQEIGREIVASLVMVAVLAPVVHVAPLDNYVTVGLVAFGATVYTLTLVVVSPRVRGKALMLAPISVDS